MNSPEEKASSIKRTSRIIRAILRTEGKWFSLSVMAHVTGMVPNTTLRYLEALREEGWIERGPGSQYRPTKYRLSREILTLLVVQGHKAIRTSEGV